MCCNTCMFKLKLRFQLQLDLVKKSSERIASGISANVIEFDTVEMRRMNQAFYCVTLTMLGCLRAS